MVGLRTPALLLGAMILILVMSVLAPGIPAAVGQGDTANETLHENPNEVDDGGEAADLVDRLGREYLETIAADAGLSREEIEELIDDDELLDALADDDETSPEEVGERLAAMEDAEENYEERRLEFFDHWETYRLSRISGEDDEVVEAAIAVSQAATEYQRAADNFIDAIERADEVTDINASERIDRVETQRSTVEQVNSQVERESFEETEFALLTVDSAGSPSSPIETVSLIATDEAGDVPSGNVSVTIDGDTVEEPVDDDGRVRLMLTPLTAHTGDREAVVRFEPDPDQPYQAVEETVPVTVSAETPTIDLSLDTESAGFGDVVTASGEVTIDGDPVADLQLAVSIGDGEAAMIETDDGGEFETERTIDTAIEPGDTAIIVEIPHENRAVGHASVAEDLEVTETATELRFDELFATETSLTLTGVLETATGVGVPGQEIEVTIPEIDDETNVTTDENGVFLLEFEYDHLESGTDLTVHASFDGTGMAVQSTESTETVSVGAHVGALDRLSSLVLHPLGLAGVGILSVAIVTAVVWVAWRRRRGEDSRQTVVTPEVVEPPDAATDDETPVIASGLALAREVLEQDPEQAVRLAYGTVRAAYAAQVTGTPSETHWEFYRHRLMDDMTDTDALRELTERYERAIYAPVGVDRAGAAAAIDAAERVAS